MATRKVRIKVEAEVIVVADDTLPIDEYELDMISRSDLAHVEDLQIDKFEVLDSK